MLGMCRQRYCIKDHLMVLSIGMDMWSMASDGRPDREAEQFIFREDLWCDSYCFYNHKVGFTNSSRGLIPSSMHRLFTALEKRSASTDYRVMVSYLEIYNEKYVMLNKRMR